MTKSTVSRIVHEEVERIASMLTDSINIDNFWLESSPKEFPLCYGIIDSTELQIQVWQEHAFSGKKMLFTLKYQAVVGIETGKLLDLFGPVVGSTHDLEVYYKSTFSTWLKSNKVQILGDKGYIGCDNVVTPYKRKNKKQPLPKEQQQYNLKLAQYRIKVENHFSHLKNWKILSNVYRGDLTTHSQIVACCELLLTLEK